MTEKTLDEKVAEALGWEYKQLDLGDSDDDDYFWFDSHNNIRDSLLQRFAGLEREGDMSPKIKSCPSCNSMLVADEDGIFEDDNYGGMCWSCRQDNQQKLEHEVFERAVDRVRLAYRYKWSDGFDRELHCLSMVLGKELYEKIIKEMEVK